MLGWGGGREGFFFVAGLGCTVVANLIRFDDFHDIYVIFERDNRSLVPLDIDEPYARQSIGVSVP